MERTTTLPELVARRKPLISKLSGLPQYLDSAARSPTRCPVLFAVPSAVPSDLTGSVRYLESRPLFAKR